MQDMIVWDALPDSRKLDLLRVEIIGLKQTIRIGIAAAGLIGTAFGSVATLVIQYGIQHFVR